MSPLLGPLGALPSETNREAALAMGLWWEWKPCDLWIALGSFFSYLKNSAHSEPKSSMVTSCRIHKIWQPPFILSHFFCPLCSNWQWLCWYIPMSLPGFCWNVQLSPRVAFIISFIKLLFSHTFSVLFEQRFSFFCHMDRVRIFPNHQILGFLLLNYSLFNSLLFLSSYYKHSGKTKLLLQNFALKSPKLNIQFL